MTKRTSPGGPSSSRYPAEYKADAVALVLEGDRTIADVARSLGLVEQTLGNSGSPGPHRSRRENRPGTKIPLCHGGFGLGEFDVVAELA